MWPLCGCCVYVTRLAFVVLSRSLSSKVMKDNSKLHFNANYVFLFLFYYKCIQILLLSENNCHNYIRDLQDYTFLKRYISTITHQKITGF